MAQVGLTWAQYRIINSILIDQFGAAVLATEIDMRKEIALDTPTPIECGEDTVEDRDGVERRCAFMRVLDLCDAIEKEVGALFQSDMINKGLDADGSPFAWKLGIKYLGDKGGRGFKFAVSVRVRNIYFRKSWIVADFAAGERRQRPGGRWGPSAS